MQDKCKSLIFQSKERTCIRINTCQFVRTCNSILWAFIKWTSRQTPGDIKSVCSLNQLNVLIIVINA